MNYRLMLIQAALEEGEIIPLDMVQELLDSGQYIPDSILDRIDGFSFDTYAFEDEE